MPNAKTTKKRPAKAAPAIKVPRFSTRLLTSLGDGRSRARYGLGDAVCRQGESADALFFIEKGKIQLAVASEVGKVGVIASLAPGAFFGEACLAGQPRYLASALATASSLVSRIEKAAMVRVLRQQPPLAAAFTAFLVARNLQIEADLVAHLFSTSEQRLARLLLLMANFGKAGKMEKVIPKVSQQTLASTIGTTRPRINAFMNRFRKLGLIEYNGDLKIHSSLLNVVIHD